MRANREAQTPEESLAVTAHCEWPEIGRRACREMGMARKSVALRRDLAMNISNSENLPLADDEILIYVGEAEMESQEQDAFEPQFGRKSTKELGLAKVELTDEELNRLRKQVQRIAGKLGADTDADQGFALDSVTLHVGVSASGQFFFIASAGVEASVEVTWRRRGTS